MALIAGAGNPVGGSSPAGTGTGLNFVGDHAYAYSGTIQGSTTSVTALAFNTQGVYIIGDFQINMPSTYGTQATLVGWMRISFNDEVVSIVTVGLVDADSQTTGKQSMLIPPYTNVTVEVVCDDNQAARLTAATFNGRVYA